MFRSFVYLDEEKLYSYKSIVEERKSTKLKDVKKTRKKSAKINALGADLGVSAEETVSGEFSTNPDYDYNEFESKLQDLEGEDYFDFVTNSNDYDLTSVPSMKLFRLNGNFTIPESFDIFNLIETFKPYLKGQLETTDTNEIDAFNSFIENASADIPIMISFDDIIISAKLNLKSLHEDYSALEECFDQDVVFLCKSVGFTRRDRVEIFNPYKDFIKLNRTMRRAMNTDTNNNAQFESLIVDGPVLKAEVIAIYK